MALSPCNTETDARGRELTVHGTPFFPVACYHDDLAARDVPWHWHEELEAILVTQGQAVVAAGGDKFTVPKGDGMVINTGVLHAVWQEGPEKCRLHSVVFHPRLVGGSLDSIYWRNYLQPVMTDEALKGMYLNRTALWQKEALDAIEDAWQACAAEAPGFEFHVREKLSRLIFLLASHRPAIPRHPSEKSLRDGERIKIMLQYIHQHYSQELSTAHIARSAMISVSECLRCFHGTIGMTPIQYVKRFRIQTAADLLRNTSKKVVDIGAICGFQEMSYFAKTFRQLMGCTPTEYRRQAGL